VFSSCSAFAPISAPSQCPWGEKAFTGYLGKDKTDWAKWDSCELVESSHFEGTVLVDQGEADNFLAQELRCELLQAAFVAAGKPLILRMQPGYDHSYYFIATFMGDHIAHHRAELAR
jgi:S-formylglutathione hydrolase